MSAGEPRLWFKSPAPTWLAALPIGNGRLGASIFGRVYKETLIFNEELSGPVGLRIATTRQRSRRCQTCVGFFKTGASSKPTLSLS